MKLRIITLIILTTILSACNMSLAEDVTPPPNYVPPTPIPTLVLVPPQTPNTANGEAIFLEKCAGCHGPTGLGDGPQGIQLPVTVPAFALPDVARPASPAGWFTTVTRGSGNVQETFMPAFLSLNDQQRWDVVAYIMTLHTSDEEIQRGKELFEENCPNCSTDFYKDLNKMSGLSTVELARIVRLGNDEIQAFGKDLPDADMWAVAEYLRSLSYNASALPTPTTIPATETPASAEATPDGTQQAEVPREAAPDAGTVSGSIENKTGGNLPSDLTVTLRGYEHDFADPSTGTQEVVTVEGTVANDGSFLFENIEVVENRIFLAEITYKGIENTSDFRIVEAGQTSVELPPLALYDVTTDLSGLVVDELDIFLTFASDGTYEVLGLYSFRNSGDAIVNVEMGDSQEIPFLRFPVGAEAGGYEALQDSAPFISTPNGFAMAPNEIPYGIIAFSTIIDPQNIEISQPLALPVSVLRVLVPDGMEADGAQLTTDSPQDIQGDIYQSYFVNELQAGDVLSFTVSGTPNVASAPTTDATNTNNTLLIGAGGLGIALILAGAWMFFRDKTQTDEDEDDGDEFETAEDVMDAIIALDDLHRSKKISEGAYQHRRAELKDILKEMM